MKAACAIFVLPAPIEDWQIKVLVQRSWLDKWMEE
jgi:hypothetical protein